MKSLSHRMIGLAAAALVLAACSRDRTSTASLTNPSLVQANVTMAQGTISSLAASLGVPALDEGMGPGPFFGPGRLSRSDVDSLTVDVTKVEVHAEVPDTENAADSAAEAAKDSASHEDEDADDHENDEATWIQLDVTGGGHLNLLNLPDSASNGIEIATGTLAPGKYKHVRLFVTGAMIFFSKQIVTPAGDTLKAGVGYPVKIPSADSTGAAVKTDESFTVPQGGGTVKLFFDGDDTIRRIVVTGDGTIIVAPVIGEGGGMGWGMMGH